MGRRFFQLAGALVLAGSLAAWTVAPDGVPTTAPSGADAAASADDATGRNWFTYGGDDAQLHFSPLDQVNAGNVGSLRLAWFHDVDAHDAFTTPLAVDGVVYYAAGMSVLTALDGATGKELWTYDPDVADSPGAQVRQRAGWAVRGIGYARGKVFVGTRDGRLIAVDARTGKMVWSVQTLDQAPNGYITGMPVVAGDNVIIGFGGADYDKTRGYVTAYNIETGKKAWRFFVVPGNPADGFENKAMEMAAKTWTGEWWKFGGGGTVWHAITYDPKYDRVYLGTGNGLPWNHKIRSPGGGDNLFLASIVALDAKTGAYVWHYQTNPGVTWDFNDAMDIELTRLKIDGKMHDVILHAPKNGFYYVIDRKNGKLLSAAKFARVNWASGIDLKTGRPIEDPAARYPNGKPFLLYPFPYGAHGVQAMAHSPQTGLTYIPVMEGGRWHVDPPNIRNFTLAPGMMVNTGLGSVAALPPPPPGIGKLVAWNPVTQKEAWSAPEPGMFNGGILATSGNLIFQGQVSGDFVAYSADKGKKLWTFDAQDGILGSPISYSVGGRQFITVIASFRSSYPSNPPWPYRQQVRRVLTFALNGTAALPPHRIEPVVPVADKSFVVDEKKAAVGAGIYNQSCVICHGPGVIGGGAAPDLRASEIPLDAEAFRSVVHDGALMYRGMGSFSNLSDAELEGLRHYIRAQAEKALQGQQAAKSGK